MFYFGNSRYRRLWQEVILQLHFFTPVICSFVSEGITYHRLSTDVRPLSYYLKIKPYLHSDDGEKQFTFDGETFINITFKYDCDEIVLHSKNLNYTQIEYWESTLPDSKMQIADYNAGPMDKLTLYLEDCMSFSKIYTFHFIYTGVMRNDLTGFYRSSFLDENNRVRWLGVTMFEPSFAREAFPCFDEPQFMAEFQVTLIRRYDFQTSHNTRLLSSIDLDSLSYADTYEKTPLMSTYTLGWLVSEFFERKNSNFSVIARAEHYGQTNYAFEIGKKLLREYDNYLAVPYQTLGISKLHFAAIPQLIPAGMENWGLVIFRESYIVYNATTTSLLDQQHIAVTISHELAHMWFGNVVVCEWWSYTWLKEGLATYFEYMMTDYIYPEWELEQQFVVRELQKILKIDSDIKQRPLSDETISSPKQVERTFGEMAYKKGSSVIRMFRHAMNETNFQAALREYIMTFKHKIVNPSKLVEVLIANWPEDSWFYVKDMFDSFTIQPGYPLITFNVSLDGKSIEISQKRFLIKAQNESSSSLLYTVPITYTTSEEMDFETTKPKLYLKDLRYSMKINLQTSVDWVIANIQQTGYYRVNYNQENWKKIHARLMQSNWGGIPPTNRAQIVDDLFNLAKSDQISYTLAFHCLEYLATEKHFLPWNAAFRNFAIIQARLGPSEHFRKYILRQIDCAYKYLGYDEKSTDTRLDIYNRKDILYHACKYGNRECISRSLSLFEVTPNIPVPLNIRFPVYCTLMREGNEGHLDEMLEMINKTKTEFNQTEQMETFKILGCIKNVKSVEKYFNFILSDGIPRTSVVTAIVFLFSYNAENVDPVYRLITANCAKLAEILESSYYDVAILIYQIANLFTSEDQLNNLRSFTANNTVEFGEFRVILDEAVNLGKMSLMEISKISPQITEYLSQSLGLTKKKKKTSGN